MTAAAFLHLGRIGLSSLFILGGIDKIADPASSLLRMEAAGLPWPVVLLIPVVLLELGAGLTVAAGGLIWNGYLVPITALLLVLHTAAINVLLHPFWTLAGPAAEIELSLFFKNVAIAGGLVMVAALHWREPKR